MPFFSAFSPNAAGQLTESYRFILFSEPPPQSNNITTTRAAAAATTTLTMSLSSVAASASVTATSPISFNRKWILKRRPVGVFDPKLDAELVVIDKPQNKDEHAATNPTNEQLEIEDHQVVVEPQLLSVDAFLRTMYDEHAYHGSLPLGATLPAMGYGRVVQAGPKSGHSVGTVVAGMLQAADKAVVDGKGLMRSFRFPFLDRSACLGLLGLTTGLTAYTGVFYVPSKAPRKGETVVVTGAAGAVGSIAVQLCKSTGARVVGVAGGPRKGEYLMGLGCDAVIDYKDKAKPLESQIAETCPSGIDFVYDNVGGETLDLLLEKINPNGRVVICGAISQYSGNLNSKTKKVRGPSNYLKLAERGAEMRGFNVIQHIAKLPFMLVGMFYLWARGKVKMTEHIETGLEQFPYALQKLFTGETIGKTLVRINRDDHE